MNELTTVTGTLPSLVDRAAQTLAGARTAAEVLQAWNEAAIAYDAAKRTEQMAKAVSARDAVLQAVRRVRADALEIEAEAKRRLADEYDAAQERGEVARDGRPKTVPAGNGFAPAQPDLGLAPAPGSAAPSTPPPATTAELGLTRKQVHEARQVRDAETADPGVVRRTLDQALDQGEEPTRAGLQRSIIAAVEDAHRPQRSQSRRNALSKPDPERKRLLRFTSLCNEIAEWEDVEALLRWDEREGSANRLRERARAAHARLEHLVTLYSKEEA